jgi:DNA processing protein
VGTRSATSYGKKICQELVEELQSHGVLVVSGLSYGVDTCSHKSAIKNELATIGILAHGLDRIYPSANKNLAKKMMSNGGLVTEFLSQTNPDRENFVRRNRIVAGLSDATIVVESAMKGGALITADIANSYNREVFAVPGPLHSQYSEGCNHLIKTNRAVLLTGVKDLEYLLNWDKAEGKGKQVQLFDLTEEEQTLVEVVKKFDKLSVEELIFHSKLTRGKMAQLLLQLELKQVVRVLPGKIVALH